MNKEKFQNIINILNDLQPYEHFSMNEWNWCALGWYLRKNQIKFVIVDKFWLMVDNLNSISFAAQEFDIEYLDALNLFNGNDKVSLTAKEMAFVFKQYMEKNNGNNLI